MKRTFEKSFVIRRLVFPNRSNNLHAHGLLDKLGFQDSKKKNQKAVEGGLLKDNVNYVVTSKLLLMQKFVLKDPLLRILRNKNEKIGL